MDFAVRVLGEGMRGYLSGIVDGAMEVDDQTSTSSVGAVETDVGKFGDFWGVYVRGEFGFLNSKDMNVMDG